MRVTLQPSGAVLETLPGERILDAAQRLGYDCPQSCRNGNCHVCSALLVHGRVLQAGEELTHGEIYTCLAEPLEACEVLWDGVLPLGELPVRTFACQLSECVEVGGDVWRIGLRAPAGKPPRYHAGQYLMIHRDNGEKSAFSLASAPESGRDLQLHVLVREASAQSLIEQLQRNTMANVELPFGDTHLAELPDGPLVLIAAGTGMAQMQSLIEHCRIKGFHHPVHLYWGVRRPDDFYEIQHWDEWKKLPNLFLHKVVSDLCGWEGRCGMLHEAVCSDIADLSAVHVYASGSPAMIYATLDALVSAGMSAHQMRADVFAYAPRP
ncbi:CDP-6-deoxy-delta-3,4-glucoseen reductase [Pseudomonas sp. DWP3-1-2]|uniref:CDP-6-deoxy-delta-3,4-glucoseen reductase n=1 Tax=Pseudomonas sp. DWP3-1-2 TaxID=2804645 RepID=UPI003CEC971C